MSTFDSDEQDLAAAFEPLHAPDRVGEYASRAPRRFRPTPGWARPVAALAIVAVLGAGAGAYLGLRGNLGGGSAAGQPGSGPSARSGASIAYDAATGTIVMFGGVGADLKGRNDTWIWDGSSWALQHPATSPPTRGGAAIAYDPSSHDVVLTGGISAIDFGGSTAVTCSGGATGSGTATGVKAPATPIPTLEPPSSSSCPSIAGPALLTDTWLWDGSNWRRAGAAPPSAGFSFEGLSPTMATDPVTGRVILVTEDRVGIPPLGAPCSSAPVSSSNSGAVAVPGCPVPVDLSARFSTWAWNGSGWSLVSRSSPASASLGVGSALVADPSSGRLDYFVSEIPTMQICGSSVGVTAPAPSSVAAGAVPAAPLLTPPADGVAPIPCPAQPAVKCCSGTVSTWTGSAWSSASPWSNGPQLSGASMAADPSAHSIVVSTNDETWTWNGAWTQRHPSTALGSSAAAMAPDGHNGVVIAFGGVTVAKQSAGLFDATWAWDGSDWRLVAGSTTPVRVLTPTPQPVPLPYPAPSSVPCPYSPGTHPGQDALPICPLPTGINPSGCPLSGAGPGGCESGGACNISWSQTGSGASVGLYVVVVPAQGVDASRCAAVVWVENPTGYNPIQTNHVSFPASAGKVGVQWTNWCGGSSAYVAITAGGDQGKGPMLTLDSAPPSCSDRSAPSTLKLVT